MSGSSDHAKLTAAASKIDFADGTSYLMSPLTDRDISELDEWLQVRYIQLAVSSLGPKATLEERNEVRLQAAEAASSLTWLSGRGASVMASIDGVTRMLWQSIKREHPTVTEQELRKHMYAPENIAAVRDRFERLNIDAQHVKKGSQEKKNKGRKTKNRKSRGRKFTGR